MRETGQLAAPGSLLAGRFRLGTAIGAGGAGVVYRARDERLDRDVAVKVFRPDVADAEALDRIRGEIRLLARLSHPTLVTLFDASTGEADEPAYLVLELVEGPTLRELYRDGLAPDEVAALGADVADALAYVAARGIVHRDVKPENVLVSAGSGAGHAKLADLGIARIVDETRHTTPGMLIGTAAYLSPEQVTGAPVGPPSDIYSLGLVLLEGLTGERAFTGGTAESSAARTLRAPAIPTWLERSDADLLARMTALDPASRPTAREVRDDLRRWRTSGLPADYGIPDPDDRTEIFDAAPAATRVLPLDDSATRVLPVGDDSPTRALPRAGAPALPEPGRRRKGHGKAIAWLVSLTLIVGAAAVGGVAAWPTIVAWMQPGPAEPPPTYPAIEGDLGNHVAQLGNSIEGSGLTDDLTLELREDVLAVATAAAVTDYESAVTSLETTADAVDQAALADQVSAARYRTILSAVDLVRADLTTAIAEAELARQEQEQQRLEDQSDTADQGLFGELRDRLDQLGKDVRRQVDDWNAAEN